MTIGDECPVPRGNKLPRPAQPLKTPSLTCKWSKPRGSGRAKLTQDLIVSPLKYVLFTYCYALPCPDIDPCPAHVFSFSQKLGFFYHNHAMTVVLVFAVVMIISTEGAPRRPMSVL